jgi:hypothetical protein
MDVSGWAAESVARIRTDGVDGVRESVRPVYNKALQGVASLGEPGMPVYEREWDLLVVVDACRLDLMREVAPAYDFVTDVRAMRSLDSTTALWMRKNFVPDYTREMAGTAYVCANPFSAEELDAGSFRALDEVWRDVWSEPGTVPPEAVTDRSIRAARERDPERLIVHYMQPHCPFLPRPELTRGKRRDRFGNQDWRDVWEKLRDGDLDRDEVWAGYRENLECALDEVGVLLQNVDADTAVVTSDHGNALGECFVYGHPPTMPQDCLRVVPWVETTATDEGTREPATHTSDQALNREEQLAALGYT